MATAVHSARNGARGARRSIEEDLGGAASVDEAVRPASLLQTLLAEPVRFLSSSRDQLRASMTLDAARAAHFEVVNEAAVDGDEEAPAKRTKAEPAPPEEPAEGGGAAPRDLYTPALSPRFARPQLRAVGLYNRGNTCYLNSVMQALLHTPPLATAMLTQPTTTLLGAYGVPHTTKQAARAADAFNSVAALRDFFHRAWQPPGGRATVPAAFLQNLRKIAKPLRPGRQEDAHEYLRFLLESLQHACTRFAPAEHQRPADPVLATTLVHRLFAGRLRSRVVCHHCQHASDTYDPCLDVSLDVRKGIGSVRQALDAFTAPEQLGGANKYKCDRCKRRVEATKAFTIDAAPPVLTVHLKRFGLLGNKINRPVSYAESLHLGKYMSERKKAPPAGVPGDPAYERELATAGSAQRYKLYAIVHHFGSGPNVGHYVASVRAPDGQWLRMDDAYVSRLPHCPLNDPSAYLLFYLREPVAPDAAAAAGAAAPAPSPSRVSPGASPGASPASSVLKRKASSASMPPRDEEPEELGLPLERQAYESLVPSPSRTSPGRPSPRLVPASPDTGSSSDEARHELLGAAAWSDERARSRKELKRRKKRKLARAAAAPTPWSPSKVRAAKPPHSL